MRYKCTSRLEEKAEAHSGWEKHLRCLRHKCRKTQCFPLFPNWKPSPMAGVYIHIFLTSEYSSDDKVHFSRGYLGCWCCLRAFRLIFFRVKNTALMAVVGRRTTIVRVNRTRTTRDPRSVTLNLTFPPHRPPHPLNFFVQFLIVPPANIFSKSLKYP